MRMFERAPRPLVAVVAAGAVLMTLAASSCSTSPSNQPAGETAASATAMVTATAAASPAPSPAAPAGPLAVTTIAGSGARGYADGVSRKAVFNQPAAVAVAPNGAVYVADSGNDLIRKITPEGIVTTVAGSGERGFADGPARAARFNTPSGLVLDGAGNLYVADTGNDLIRKIGPDGAVTTVAGSGQRGFADGQGRVAQFNAPSGVAIDATGTLYVADTGNDLIRKVAPDGTVSTFAGAGERGFADGQGRAAKFNAPAALILDPANSIFVADSGNDLIRRINPDGTVSTLAGAGERGFADGPAHEAKFNTPSGILLDPASGALLVADTGNDLIRKVAGDGSVTTFAGAGQRGYFDAAPLAAQFNEPAGLARDGAGNIYVADRGNNLVREITGESVTMIFAGTGARGFANGQALAAVFNEPHGVALDGAGNVYVADTGNDLIRKIGADGAVTTVAGSGTRGYTDGQGESAEFNAPEGVALDVAGNVYVADTGNDLIRRIGADGTVTTLAGSGIRGYADGGDRVARFNAPGALVVDAEGNVYVADTGNDLVRRIAPDGSVSTVAGSGERGFADGQGKEARFNAPAGIARDGAGNLFVSDSGNDLIRKISPDGAVTTFAGAGERGFSDGPAKVARFNTPAGLAFDRAGALVVADSGNAFIRRIAPDGGVSTIAGTGERGFADGPSRAAQFNMPTSVAVDAEGNVYVADAGNNLLRKVTAGR